MKISIFSVIYICHLLHGVGTNERIFDWQPLNQKLLFDILSKYTAYWTKKKQQQIIFVYV